MARCSAQYGSILRLKFHFIGPLGTCQIFEAYVKALCGEAKLGGIEMATEQQENQRLSFPAR